MFNSSGTKYEAIVVRASAGKRSIDILQVFFLAETSLFMT